MIGQQPITTCFAHFPVNILLYTHSFLGFFLIFSSYRCLRYQWKWCPGFCAFYIHKFFFSLFFNSQLILLFDESTFGHILSKSFNFSIFILSLCRFGLIPNLISYNLLAFLLLVAYYPSLWNPASIFEPYWLFHCCIYLTETKWSHVNLYLLLLSILFYHLLIFIGILFSLKIYFVYSVFMTTLFILLYHITPIQVYRLFITFGCLFFAIWLDSLLFCYFFFFFFSYNLFL